MADKFFLLNFICIRKASFKYGRELFIFVENYTTRIIGGFYFEEMANAFFRSITYINIDGM